MSGRPEQWKLFLERVRRAPIQAPPPPWLTLPPIAIGGLVAVGFSPNSELLLVVSDRGRGVFDCATGERVARDPSMPEAGERDWYDSGHLDAEGIGPLAGLTIRVSGLNGGGLPIGTPDGWCAERVVFDWPEESLLLVHPGSGICDFTQGKEPLFTKVAVDSEIRAWGFSPNGRTLVMAVSSDLHLYYRG